MKDTARTGLFWDSVVGRAPVPAAAQTLGFEFVSVDEAGSIEVTFRAGPEMTTPFGEVLGGFLAAMLYDTVGPAVLSTLGHGEFISTLDLATHFLNPAAPGRISGHGQIVGRVGDVVVAEAALRNTSDILATATASIRVVRIEEHETSKETHHEPA